MVNFLSILSFACVIVLSFTDVSSAGGGFSVDLIHRDSPKSPLYNPSESPTKRLAKALRRSLGRVNHFRKPSVSIKDAQSKVIPNNGEYLMNISIGTPPSALLSIVDTGSDLIWTQCEPCPNCYKQVIPLFDPKSSRTYRPVSCDAKSCGELDGTSCDDNNLCQYSVSYGDQSHSYGNVAIDTITLGPKTGRPVSFPAFTFGCGHDNAGTFDAKGTGIVGLGGGSVSLVSQLGASIAGKFSYCLVPFFESNSSSKLSFGSEAIVSGETSVSTPLSKSTDYPDFYFLTLEAISVGDERITLNEASSNEVGDGAGNIIIDSGTTLTLLPSSFYSNFESKVASSITEEPVEDPSGVLSLCYNSQSNFSAPAITIHFTNADLKLDDYNSFLQVSEGVVCLAFTGNDDLSIYGNIAQSGFLVGYDLEQQTVSFLRTDCSNS